MKIYKVLSGQITRFNTDVQFSPLGRDNFSQWRLQNHAALQMFQEYPWGLDETCSLTVVPIRDADLFNKLHAREVLNAGPLIEDNLYKGVGNTFDGFSQGRAYSGPDIDGETSLPTLLPRTWSRYYDAAGRAVVRPGCDWIGETPTKNIVTSLTNAESTQHYADLTSGRNEGVSQLINAVAHAAPPGQALPAPEARDFVPVGAQPPYSSSGGYPAGVRKRIRTGPPRGQAGQEPDRAADAVAGVGYDAETAPQTGSATPPGSKSKTFRRKNRDPDARYDRAAAYTTVPEAGAESSISSEEALGDDDYDFGRQG